MKSPRFLAPAILALAAACGAPVDEEPAAPDAGTELDAGPPPLCEAEAIACEDQLYQELNLQKKVAKGEVGNTLEGTVWASTIDATAGGAFTSTPDAYVYARFDPELGLQKVELTDEDALASHDWDVAFRRYVIRINSGDSGSSCVHAARVPPGKSFDEITSVDDDLIWRVDDFFNDACEFVSDGTGLGSSPAAALASYYTYSSANPCVKMTRNVFVVAQRGGRHVKMYVDAYYAPENQAKCDSGSPSQMAPGGHFIVKWAYID